MNLVVRSTSSYCPDDLARWLDQWAQRREKVLPLIDVRSARVARLLADRCRSLGMCEPRWRSEAWLVDWNALREDIARFLSLQGRESASLR